MAVSIHAPTRGATLVEPVKHRDTHESVSIHAPTRGATTIHRRAIAGRPRSTPPREGRHRPRTTLSPSSGFDPRPHARGDGLDSALSGARLIESVSIHAPTRGATAIGGGLAEPLHVCFDPRPHARGDLDKLQRTEVNQTEHKFRSTPPREGRPSHQARIGDCLISIVSIHAPTRGATPLS